jgi:uncharacterized damage-inducible protein DinB
MSALGLLQTLFNYQAWANDEFLEKMEDFDPELHRQQQHAAMRLINHSCVVAQIFAAHLSGAPHNFSTDNPMETPAVCDLRAAVAASGRWYLEYLETVTPDQLTELVPFSFTDGDRGYMSRQEMLTHLIVHGCYHRGEVGRIMAQLCLGLPWDTFAVYLHQAEAWRRRQTVEAAR